MSKCALAAIASLCLFAGVVTACAPLDTRFRTWTDGAHVTRRDGSARPPPPASRGDNRVVSDPARDTLARSARLVRDRMDYRTGDPARSRCSTANVNEYLAGPSKNSAAGLKSDDIDID
jgi:hypothetical protein